MSLSTSSGAHASSSVAAAAAASTPSSVDARALGRGGVGLKDGDEKDKEKICRVREIMAECTNMRAELFSTSPEYEMLQTVNMLVWHLDSKDLNGSNRGRHDAVLCARDKVEGFEAV